MTQHDIVMAFHHHQHHTTITTMTSITTITSITIMTMTISTTTPSPPPSKGAWHRSLPDSARLPGAPAHLCLTPPLACMGWRHRSSHQQQQKRAPFRVSSNHRFPAAWRKGPVSHVPKAWKCMLSPCLSPGLPQLLQHPAVPETPVSGGEGQGSPWSSVTEGSEPRPEEAVEAPPGDTPQSRNKD